MAHLRRVVADELADIPPPTLSRYEAELLQFNEKHYKVELRAKTLYFEKDTNRQVN